jgi:hypothetical protein
MNIFEFCHLFDESDLSLDEQRFYVDNNKRLFQHLICYIFNSPASFHSYYYRDTYFKKSYLIAGIVLIPQ